MRWMALDNAAKIYPPAATRKWSAMFRLSVNLTEDVDPAVLEEANARALKRFPSFACRLRRGLFWYYLEHMDGAPPLHEDIYNPLSKLNEKSNGHFMYRLLYYKNRIACEFFHALTDGTGGMTFLLSTVAEYIRLKYGDEVEPSQYVLSCDEEPDPEEYGDSFLKYAAKETISRKEGPSYNMSGSAVPFNKMLFISAKIPTDALVGKAKEHGVTVGVFLSSLLLYSTYKKQQTEKSKRKRKKDVKISVPLDLRRFFPSRTLRNFSAYINPSISPRLGEYSFDEILVQVKHFMGLYLNEKELRGRFSANVASEKNVFVRAFPLFIKFIVLKMFYIFQGDKYYASTISNLGLVKLPDGMAERIGRIDFMPGRALIPRSNCSVVSYKGNTYINFTRTILESDIEKCFLTELVKMGVPVFVEGNERY